jgi:hypothetical protein
MQICFCRRPAVWLVGLLVVFCGCTAGSRRDEAQKTAPPLAGEGPSAAAGGPRMANKDFSIVRMSTAHGAFVIELETENPERIGDIARVLVEPIKSQYQEVLVYATRPSGDRPARRVVWTPKDGYVELDYETK